MEFTYLKLCINLSEWL